MILIYGIAMLHLIAMEFLHIEYDVCKNYDMMYDIVCYVVGENGKDLYQKPTISQFFRCHIRYRMSHTISYDGLCYHVQTPASKLFFWTVQNNLCCCMCRLDTCQRTPETLNSHWFMASLMARLSLQPHGSQFYQP